MNRKIIISILACGILLSSLTACSDNANKNPERTGNTESQITSQPESSHFHFIEREDSTPDTVYNQDKTVAYIKNTCEKVSFVALERVDSDIAREMNAVLSKAYDSHRASSGTLMDDLNEYLENGDVDESVFPWETKVDYNCTRNDGKAISVIETTDFYSASKLSGTTVRTYNFEPTTGKQITNIFYEVGNDEAFNAMDDFIYKKLIEKYGEDKGITYTMPNLTSMVDEAMNSWYFTATGIKIIFNPGSIAPTENGNFELEIAKSDLPDFAQSYFN